MLLHFSVPQTRVEATKTMTHTHTCSWNLWFNTQSSRSATCSETTHTLLFAVTVSRRPEKLSWVGQCGCFQPEQQRQTNPRNKCDWSFTHINRWEGPAVHPGWKNVLWGGIDRAHGPSGEHRQVPLTLSHWSILLGIDCKFIDFCVCMLCSQWLEMLHFSCNLVTKTCCLLQIISWCYGVLWDQAI